jgi:hypothetical protein
MGFMLRTFSFLCALLAGSATALAQDDTSDPLAVPGEDTSGEASGEATASGEVSAEGGASVEGGASADMSVGSDEGGGAGGGGFGVGAIAMLTGPFGAAIVYDPGKFHIEGILGFSAIEDVDTIIALGGRFYYHLHTSTAADFSVGGGLGISIVDQEAADESDTAIHIEAGGQVRTFVVPNVALAASLGLAVVSADGSDFVGLTGNLVGSLGVTYFF